jgi:hypothetical protein
MRTYISSNFDVQDLVVPTGFDDFEVDWAALDQILAAIGGGAEHAAIADAAHDAPMAALLADVERLLAAALPAVGDAITATHPAARNQEPQGDACVPSQPEGASVESQRVARDHADQVPRSVSCQDAVTPSPSPMPSPSTSSSLSPNPAHLVGQDMYVVSRILGDYYDDVEEQIYYHVQWKGYTETTWEPLGNLMSEDGTIMNRELLKYLRWNAYADPDSDDDSDVDYNPDVGC